MANNSAHKKLLEKYGVTGKYANGNKGEQKQSASPTKKEEQSKSQTKNNSSIKIDTSTPHGKLLEKYGVTGKYANAKVEKLKTNTETTNKKSEYPDTYFRWNPGDSTNNVSSTPDTDGVTGWDIAGASIMSGLGTFNKGLMSTLDFILPTEFLKEHDFISNWNDYYSKQDEIHKQNKAKLLEGKSGATKLISDVGEMSVAALPNALLALMSSGASAGATAGTSLLATGTSATAGAGTSTMIANSAREMIKNPAYWSSMAQTLGTDYEEAKADGANEFVASAAAIIKSGINAGVEVSGGFEMLPDKLKSGNTKPIINWITSSLEEGEEEVVQGVISASVEAIMYDHTKEFASLTDEDAIINPQRMGKEFGMGAAVGGVLGGMQTGVITGIDAITRTKQQNDKLDTLINDEESLDMLIEQGKANGKVSSKLAEDIEKAKAKGNVTREQVEKLIAANDAYNQYNNSEPDTIEQAARDVVEERNKVSGIEVLESRKRGKVTEDILDTLSKNNVEITKDEVKKVTGFGDYGSELVANYSNKDGVSFSQVVRDVKASYTTGFTHPDMDIKKVAHTFNSQAQQDAYTAGQQDGTLDMMAKQEGVKNAIVHKDAGFNARMLPTDVTESEVATVDLMAKALGVKSYMANGLLGNAELDKATGEVPIDTTFEREILTNGKPQKVSLVFHAAHEMAVHRVVELAPEEGTAFVYAMYDFLAGNESSIYTLADAKRYQYAGKGVNISLAQAMEEVTANNILRLYGNDETKFHNAIERIVNGEDVKAKEGLRKYIDYLNKMIRKILNFLSGKSAQEKANMQPQLDEITKLRDMFETAFRKATHNVKAKTDTNSTKNLEIKINEEYNGSISHSLYTDEVIFSSRYKELTQSQTMRDLYNSAKKGDVKAAYDLISQLLTKDDINKIKSLGNDVHLLSVAGIEGTSTNVLPSIISKHISTETGQDIFYGIGKDKPSNSRDQTIWDRMKENYPSFTFDENTTKRDIEGKKFVLIDDNSTTGRTFVGLKNFLEENGGEVVGYYALTTGQDQSEKMITTDKTWNEILNLGLEEVNDFAEKEGVMREISQRGLTERETKELIKQYKRTKTDSRRSVGSDKGIERSGRDVRTIFDAEKKDGSNEISYSLKDSNGKTLTEEQAEYFKDSKVRDENGNLLVMYQGSNEDFTVFDRKKSSYANLYGRGFYFTKSENHGRQYGNTRAYYLDIKHPVSTTETTITKAQLRKFLKAVTENEDYSFENYGYGATVESVLQSTYGKTDFLMLNDVSQTAIGDLVEAVELFNEINGTDYDGIVLDTETVTFNSEQAKLTTNKKPTSNPDINFSLKQSVEETKDLVALHNVREDKLLESFKLGGLPSPSIAITKKDMLFDKFGDISLIFRKDSISPTDRRNKIYSGDAYTPTGVRVEYDIDDDILQEFNKKLKELTPELTNERLPSVDSGTAQAENDSLYNAYERNDRAKLAFLREKGKTLKLAMRTPTLSGFATNDAIIALAKAFSSRQLNDIANTTEGVKQYKNACLKVIRDNSDSRVVESGIYSADSVSLWDVADVARLAAKVKENKYKIKKEVDNRALYDLIDKKFTNALKAEYKTWIDENTRDAIIDKGIRNNRDLFTPSGNRRSFKQLHEPYNLSNIVKQMFSGEDKGIALFGGSPIGAAQRLYSSIADVKADSGRIQDLEQEEYDKIRDSIEDDVFELARKMQINSDVFAVRDLLSEAIGKKTKQQADLHLKREAQGWAKYSPEFTNELWDIRKRILNMPTQYFEAKPQRAVGFNEVVAAIIPRNKDKNLKNELESRGIKVLEYSKEKDGDRLKKINSVSDVSFSLKGTTHIVTDEERMMSVPEKLAKYAEEGMISTEAYQELIDKYGFIPYGENPHRDIQVPKKTAKNKKVSQTVRTILEAEVTPDNVVPTIEKMVEDGIFSYDVYTDKQAIKDAEDYLNEYGWIESYNDWMKDVNSGVVSKQHTVMGWALYNNAVNTATTTTSETERKTAMNTAISVLDAMVRHQRNAAQALQATRVLKKLSPETQLYAVQKSVNAYQQELTNKYGKKAPDLKIDEELASNFLNAKTEEERLDAEIEIYKDIGRQMPSDWLDKWNAWRYLAMLGNLRTHGRNIAGNAFFAPVVITKDIVATAIESAVYRISGKKTLRGKALIWGSKSDRALLKAAWNDYSNVADLVSNGGKYNDSAMANQHIQEGRQIFKFKPLEWARKGNSKALEVEDVWFSKPHYAYAMAQYCKANNITPEQIAKGKAIAPAREYAIKEAQKATYKDTNAFSQMVSEWGRTNKKEKNGAKKVLNTVIEGILPFRKTPANILARGVEYSPIGLLKGLTYDLVQVGKGKMSATEVIDNISTGLTGTGLLALGAYLAAQGLVRGHGEDDEEKEFKELMGHQAYSLELPNGESITLDWLAPEALPFFVGVNLWESKEGSKEGINLSTILQSVSRISEPMLEMSCLQGINDLLESVGYASSNDTSGLISILASATTSYLTQGIPTLLGQFERTGEEQRMTTYTEKDAFLTDDMQYTLGKASAKIPFWDYNQIPYIDAWGRKEASGTALKRGLNNFLNPAYTSTIDTSKMEEELLRVYEETGEAGVFPERADKYFTVDGKRKDLTADEYVRYATLKGEKSYKVVSDLVNSKAYKSLTDQEKAKAIKDAYDYANQKAKESISNYKPENWVSKADEFGSNVGNYISFKTEVSSTKEENGGKIEKTDVVDIILDMAQNESEMWKMYLSQYDSKGDMYAYDKYIEGDAYMKFIKSLDYVDKPNESGKYGTYTQEETTKAINRLKGLSQKEKRILWQSQFPTSKKNPF